MMIVVLVRENFVEWWRKFFITDEFFFAFATDEIFLSLSFPN
jgi:hypothetical protein